MYLVESMYNVEISIQTQLKDVLSTAIPSSIITSNKDSGMDVLYAHIHNHDRYYK